MEEKLKFLQEIVDLKNKEVRILKRKSIILSRLEQLEYKYYSINGEIDTIENYDVIFEEGNDPIFLLDNDSYYISDNKLIIKNGLTLQLYSFNLLTHDLRIKKTYTEPDYTPELRYYESCPYGYGEVKIYNIFVNDEYAKNVTPLILGENIKLDKKLSEGNKDLLGIKLIWHPFKETLFDPEEEEEKKYKYPENVF